MAQSALGDTAAGRRTLRSLVAWARQVATRPDLLDVLEPRVMAAIYGRLGEPEEAVRWLEAGLRAPVGWTVRGYANEPKTKVLRGPPAFERFAARASRVIWTSAGKPFEIALSTASGTLGQ